MIPGVVTPLFASGKLICTGVVNEKTVYDAVEKLMAELVQKGSLNQIVNTVCFRFMFVIPWIVLLVTISFSGSF